jgi:soluble lytic murein transglycosylase-like protein
MLARSMSVYRSSIITFGLVVLSECIAFGNGKDQVAAQVAQPAEHQGLQLLDPIEGPDANKANARERVANGQDKSRVSAPQLPAIAPASGAPSRPDLQPSDLRDSVCLMIEAAGRAHDVPPEFFARVIWQESRFRPDTVGPRRRNGESAQGIAQFMPSTAADRGLLDPFDPVQALPKAAQFLRELNDQFGNLGLAAAAYDAGPARVRAWLAGAGPLSAETRKYVAAVTGIPADEWAKGGGRKLALKKSPNCGELMALLQEPVSPQRPELSSSSEPAESHKAQLAKNDPIAAPLGPARGELATAHQEVPSSRSDDVKQTASPRLSSPSEPAQSHKAQLAKNDPIAGESVIPYQETPYSQGDMNLFIEKLTERVKLTADSPWGVQLNAGFSREGVLAAYATIASRYAQIFAGKDASILSSVFRSRGTRAFYQIRVGTDTLESANNLCADIRRAGGACMVIRNRS